MTSVPSPAKTMPQGYIQETQFYAKTNKQNYKPRPRQKPARTAMAY